MKHKYLKNVTTLKLDNNKCKGCEMCTRVCPHAVFAIEDGKAVIRDLNACMECGACARNCVFAAISVDAGVGCAAAIINSMIYGGEPSCDCSGGKEKGGGACC